MYFVIFFVAFAHALEAFAYNLKSSQAEKIFHNSWSLKENNARSAANQRARTIAAI